MNEKDRKALIKAQKGEFYDRTEEELHKAYRDCAKHLQIIEEEMGLTRMEALYFLANMCHPNK